MSVKCTMILGDSLDVLPLCKCAPVEMMFADLPYSTQRKTHTALEWDVPADIKRWWSVMQKAATNGCAYVFTANLPLASLLYAANVPMYRHDLIHAKNNSTGFLHAKRAPLKSHEMILVFARGKFTFNPQMTESARTRRDHWGDKMTKLYHLRHTGSRVPREYSYPKSIVESKWEKTRFTGTKRTIHPTQKPVALLDWLIRTYSNPRECVLDPVAGSFTTCVSACQNGRSSIGIEKDKTYFEAGLERVYKTVADQKLDVQIEVVR